MGREDNKSITLEELTALKDTINIYIKEISAKDAEIGSKVRVISSKLSSIEKYKDDIFNSIGMIIDLAVNKEINDPKVKEYREVANMCITALNDLDNTIDGLKNLSGGYIIDAREVLSKLKEFEDVLNNPSKSDEVIDAAISRYQRYLEEKVEPTITVLNNKYQLRENIENIDDISEKIDDVTTKITEILNTTKNAISSIKNSKEVTAKSNLENLNKIVKIAASIVDIVKVIKNFVNLIKP